MASVSNSEWFMVELSLRSLQDNSSTTIKLTSRPTPGATPGTYFPLLERLSGVGFGVDQYLPIERTAQLQINNKPESMGFQRKFSDLLSRYTLIQQTVKVYAARTDPDSTDPTSAFVEIWRGVGASIRMENGTNPTVLVNLRRTNIDPRVVTKSITRAEFPDAPQRVIGQSLPLVFGESAEVVAYPINEEDSVNGTFAFATTLADEFAPGAVNDYYAKNADGNYIAVAGAATTTTRLHGHFHGGYADMPPLDLVTLPDGTDHWYAWGQGIRELAREFTTGDDNAKGQIITRVRYWLSDSAYAGSTADEIVIKIYDTRFEGVLPFPGKVIAQGRRNFSDKQNWGPKTAGTAGFIYWIDIELDRPAILEGGAGRRLFISRSITTSSADRGSYYTPIVARTEEALSYSTWELSDNTENRNDWVLRTYTTSGGYEYYEIFGATITPTLTPSTFNESDGLGYSSFVVACNNSNIPKLSALDMLVDVEGMRDTVGGTVTGTPYEIINTAEHVADLMLRPWSSGTWINTSKLDQSRFSATHAKAFVSSAPDFRKISGRTTGRTLLSAFLSDVMKNSASRLVGFNGGASPLGLYAYGTPQTDAVILDDNLVSIRSVELLSTDTIVNRLQIFHTSSLSRQRLESISADGRLSSYFDSVDSEETGSPLRTAAVQLSQAIFGLRELRDVNFDLLDNEPESAAVVAKLLLDLYSAPHAIVSFELPYFDYYDVLTPLTTCVLQHPDLPSFFGSAPSALLPLNYSEGAEVDLNRGWDWKRAQRWRVQVELAELAADSAAPARLQVVARLLGFQSGDVT